MTDGKKKNSPLEEKGFFRNRAFRKKGAVSVLIRGMGGGDAERDFIGRVMPVRAVFSQWRGVLRYCYYYL